MADSTLDSELLVLIDTWPGVAKLVEGSQIPTGGFTGSTHHNVATPKYAPGEKLCVWNESGDAGKAGMSTFIYLQLTTAAGPTVAAKQFCVPGSATTWYVVSNDPDADSLVVEGAAMAAVAISAFTSTYWGWFWCGGICPEGHVSALGGNYATEGNVAAGAVCTNNLAADAIGLGPCAADTEAIIGFALAADAA